MREATAMGGQDGALAESVQMHVANARVCYFSDLANKSGCEHVIE